jgi:hypothetical protein
MHSMYMSRFTLHEQKSMGRQQDGVQIDAERFYLGEHPIVEFGKRKTCG